MSHFLSLSDVLDTIIPGDAIEILKNIPSSSVDMTFADPPFNLKKSYTNYKDAKELNEYNKWCKEWIAEMVRITAPTGSIFVHNIPRWLTYHVTHLNKIAKFKHWIAWNAMGAPLGKTLLPNHYGILYYVKSDKFTFHEIRIHHPRCRVCHELLADYGGKKEKIHEFGVLLSDVWTDIHRIRHTKRRDEHPCQLPIPLLERLILMATNEGDIVLDPFMGTGTTAIAAKKLGRHFIGVEIDPLYIEIANKKVEQAKPSKINGCYVSLYLNKISSIRNEDYEHIKELLQTKNLNINEDTVKQLTLPYFMDKHAPTNSPNEACV